MSLAPSSLAGKSYMDTSTYTKLNEEQIQDGNKRIHELYPLFNARLGSLFPFLNFITCGCGETKKVRAKHCEDCPDDNITDQSVLESGSASQRKKREAILPNNSTRQDLKTLGDVHKRMESHELFKSKIQQPDFVKDKISIENERLN